MNAGTQWDYGAQTLAALGYDGPEVARKFHAWLLADKWRMAPRKIQYRDSAEVKRTRNETRAEVIDRLARAFLRKHEGAVTIESAAYVDPETGKRIDPNGVKRRRRRPWVETYRMQGRLTIECYGAALRLYAVYHGNAEYDPLAAMSGIRSTAGNDPQVTRIDRRREYFALWADIPKSSRPVIEHVVLNDRPIRGMAGCSNVAAHDRHMKRLIAGLTAIC